MENYPGLARGFYKGDRTECDQLWKDLTTELNSLGPPEKDQTGWKKDWNDWKACIRKKLSENRMEATATGGGPNNMQHISSKEDAVAKLCGLYTAAEGVSNTKSFGVTRKEETPSIESENLESNSIHAELNALLEDEGSENAEPKAKRKRKFEPTQTDLQNFIENQMSTNEKIFKVLEDLNNTSKQGTRRNFKRHL